MQDVYNAPKLDSTDNSFENLAENFTNVFITGAGVLLSDCDDPSPAETTKNSEEVCEDLGA